ncbi:MAG: glycoside hydrolase family 2 TIM barrel-domain containing protein [Acidobacteriota bacterium]
MLPRAFVVLLSCCPLFAAATGGRVTVPLDGTWEIEESVAAGEMPRQFGHRVPVPGLANMARPPFADVDLFDSRELIDNRVRRKQLPESARISTAGIPRQKRNYFWYRTAFRPPARKQVAILKVNKAQFGTAVWLNGQRAGEHHGCFTAGYFDLTKLVRWDGDNELVMRLGAHPAALPPSVPAGTDFEKLKWTPGIYDSVSLLLSDNPVIETIQVAPRISPPQILVETRLRNYGAAPVAFALEHRVKTWKDQKAVAAAKPQQLKLAPGEERTVRQAIPIPGARLWSPEDPFLYVVESSTGGDSAVTRFGLREFRFDTPTRRAYLNGKVYFLRGSNITLHRFFEDPLAGALPWDEKWVRKLLIDIPKRMHWNSFRFCIGPVPEKWLDIADEAGLLIQYEYFIWTGGNLFHAEWTAEELTRELSEWVRDNWNHPSVAIWDACNETVADVLGSKVIPAARKLDLSNRPWDNGYNLPQDPNDPIEDHPYLFGRIVPGRTPPFRISDLETMVHHKQSAAPHPTAHASILNEYGWLWLTRDGSPTLLTREVYDTLLGPDATGQERLVLWAYLLGGLTEFWRAHRYHAAVLHFVYLTASFPGAYTSDHWRDVEKLELEPHFEDYAGEAFKPLGVYLNFWQPSLKAESSRRLAVAMVNDDYEPAKGKLVLSLEAGGGELARQETEFLIPALGQHSYQFELRVPKASGACLLKATAYPEGTRHRSPTVSRRKVSIAE